MDIRDLIGKGESDTVEFKQKPNENVKKFLKTVSAFANGPGGKIIFGISDNGEITGLEGNYHEVSDRLTDLIVSEVIPEFLFKINPVTIDGKHILVLDISHGPDTPYYLKNEGMEQGTYVRINGTTRKCSYEMIKDFMLQGRRQSFDTIRIVGKTIDRDDKHLRELCEFASSKSGRKIDETTLCNWGLLIRDGEVFVPTNGFALLTDNSIPHARIECARFEGNTRSTILRKKTFDGPLYEQIEKATEFVEYTTNSKMVFEGNYNKVELEIPQDAVRELVTNAVVHRCYNIDSSPIFVGVYDDSVEIISPGLLPDGMTTEDAVSGSRRHRNVALAEFLTAIKMMEGWGSGLQRAFQLCTDHGLHQPIMEMCGENMHIRIIREGAEPHGMHEAPLDDLDTAILDTITDDPNVTLPQISEKLGTSIGKINSAVKKLKKDGRLSREGSRKTGSWKVL